MAVTGLSFQTRCIRKKQKPRHFCNWKMFWKELVVWLTSLFLSVGIFIVCFIMKNYVNAKPQLAIDWLAVLGKQPDYFVLYATLAFTSILTLVAHERQQFGHVIAGIIICVISFLVYVLIFFELTVRIATIFAWVNLALFIAVSAIEIIICYKVNLR